MLLFLRLCLGSDVIVKTFSNKSAFSFLHQLSTWHSPHPAAAAVLLLLHANHAEIHQSG